MPVRKTKGVFCGCSTAAMLVLSRVKSLNLMSRTAKSKRVPLASAASAASASPMHVTAAPAASSVCWMSSAIKNHRRDQTMFAGKYPSDSVTKFGSNGIDGTFLRAPNYKNYRLGI